MIGFGSGASAIDSQLISIFLNLSTDTVSQAELGHHGATVATFATLKLMILWLHHMLFVTSLLSNIDK